MFNAKERSNQYRLNGEWMVCKHCGGNEFARKEMILTTVPTTLNLEMLTCVGCGITVFVNPKYGDLKELLNP